MGSVDRIARLKADDAAPPALGKRRTRLGGITRELGIGRRDALEDRHAAAEIERLLLVEPRDARVLAVGRAEALLGLALLVVLEHLLHVERRKQAALLVGERDDVALRRLVHSQAHRAAPRAAGTRDAFRR